MASSPPCSLLLLSPLPCSPSYTSLDEVYGSALSSVFVQVAKLPNGSSKAALLQIALPCLHLYEEESSPRSRIFDETQRSLAIMYSLISVICSRNSIEVEDRGGVNAMILPVSYGGTISSESCHAPHEDILQGPIVNLRTLAASCRPWTHIFSLDTKEGQKVLNFYLGLKQSVSSPDQMPTKIVKIAHTSEMPSSINNHGKDVKSEHGSKRHIAVAVGGTFDHLHAGHKLLLTMTAIMVEPWNSEAASQERSITVGITGDELLKNKKYAEYLESWEDRQLYVTNFLQSLLNFTPPSREQPHTERKSGSGPNAKAVHTLLKPGLVLKCVEISDPFGPTITDEAISALIVSAETQSGGKAINGKRLEKGWQGLEVYQVEVLDADDQQSHTLSSHTNTQDKFQSKISSTAIRQQKSEKALLDRNG